MRSLLCLSVACVLILGACGDGAPTSNPRTEAPTVSGETPAPSRAGDDTAAPSTTGVVPAGERVLVDAVLDGDSLAVDRQGRRTEVRLAGVNTPERDECYGDEARRLLESLIEAEVILVPVEGEGDTDQFGRLLRNVWSGGTWLNLALVEQGAALAIQTGSPDEARLVAAEDAAWQGGFGLWGTAACGDYPAGIEIVDVRYDPPGRDSDNADDEYVEIENRGDAVVDMSGWIVRDESSTHRYVFADGASLQPGAGVRLRTGCGAGGSDLHWCAADAVWSNGGDTVILQTASGTVVDRWKYPGDY